MARTIECARLSGYSVPVDGNGLVGELSLAACGSGVGGSSTASASSVAASVFPLGRFDLCLVVCRG